MQSRRSASPGVRVLGALLFVALVDGPALAIDGTEVKLGPADQKRFDTCDSLRGELREKASGDPKVLRESWVAAGPRCAGTGIYEYLLATDARNAGDGAAAVAIYEGMVKRKLPLYENAFTMLNTLSGEAALASDPPDMKRVRALRDELAKFAAEHEPHAFAYQQLAAANVTLKDWPAAIDAARKSNQVDRMYGRASRYLVLALHQTDRCPEAVEEMQPALANSRELLADMDFMLPVSDCLALTGDPENGEKALQALLRNNPSAKDDPRVLQLQKFYAQKNQAK